MKPDYQKYIVFYKYFATAKGYYDACNYLAYQDNRWQGIERYIKIIKNSILNTKIRLGKNKILMADICCGAYGWLQKYFSNYASKIVCIDSNKEALDQIALLKNPLVKTIRDDAFSLRKIVSLGIKFDFIYCGFNVYEGFIDNFLKLITPGGCIFLMKPKTGDDLILRSLVKNYDILTRYKEIVDITIKLGKEAKVEYWEESFSWKFKNEDVNKLLAAMSVVCLGKPTLMTEEQYNIAVDFLKLKMTDDNILLMSQIFSLWQAIKK